MIAAASLYGVSATTVYRELNRFKKPHAAHRADNGKPRVLDQPAVERYCELIAALIRQPTAITRENMVRRRSAGSARRKADPGGDPEEGRGRQLPGARGREREGC